MELPFITQGLEGTGGVIKNKPEHFIVEEIPLYLPSGTGTHLFLNITKKSLASTDLQKKIAALFRIKTLDIGMAGLKDKDSVSTQMISVPIGNTDAESINSAIEKIRLSLPIQVNWARLHANKLKPGHLLGNKFTIIISDIGIDTKTALSRAENIISEIKREGIPNYYGSQRFGIEEKNIEKGHNLIKGKIQVNDRWLRKFLISSYQSYLCNLYLAERLNSGLFSKIIRGDIAKKYSTGGLFEVKDTETDQKRYISKEISFTAPMYGIKMWDASHESKELEDRVLKSTDITLNDFRIMKITGTRRLGRLLVDDIEAKKCQEGILLKFSLPKGAFATNVLREIMKVEPASVPAHHQLS